jgi:hypothetical protein
MSTVARRAKGVFLPRINIEESIHKDARFDELKVRLGGRFAAMGALVYAWSLAQTYYLKNGGKIPIPEWEKQLLPIDIIDVGLATLCDDFVTMCGVDEQFAWLKQRSESGKRGGLKTQGKSSSDRLVPLSDRQASSSSSFSSSKRNTNTLVRIAPLIGRVYDAYPRKEGKAKGVAILSKLSDADLVLAEKAALNYAEHCRINGRGKNYIMLFKTWCGEWRDWVDHRPEALSEADAWAARKAEDAARSRALDKEIFGNGP